MALPEINQGLFVPGHPGPHLDRLLPRNVSQQELRNSQRSQSVPEPISPTLASPGPKALLPFSEIEAALEFMRSNRRHWGFLILLKDRDVLAGTYT